MYSYSYATHRIPCSTHDRLIHKAYFLRDTFVPSVRCHHHTVPCPQAATSHVQGRDIRFTLYATYLCHPVSPRTSSYWYSSYSYAIPVGGKYGEAATLHPLKADAHPRKAAEFLNTAAGLEATWIPRCFNNLSELYLLVSL